jgi:hypothetical protein
VNYEDIVKKIKEISGYDPSEMPGPDAPLNAAKGAMRVRDAVIGAPTRAALQAMQRGEDMGAAFAGQFGENPDKAPTGQDLLKNDPNTAPYADSKALGLAVEVVADPTIAPMVRFPKIKQMTKIAEPGAITQKGIRELAEFADMASMVPKTPIQKVMQTRQYMKERPGMSPEIALLQTDPNEVLAARLEKRLDKLTPEYYYDTEMGKLVHDPKLLKADEATKEIPTEESIEAYKKILEMMAKRKKSS